MPFNGKSGKFNASINTVEFGCGDKAVKIGGENVYRYIHLTLRSKTHRRSAL